MGVFLTALLDLSLSGAALILVLYVMIRLWGGHMGRGWQYYIWLAVVLRLIIPVPSPVSLIRSASCIYAMGQENVLPERQEPVLPERLPSGNTLSGNTLLGNTLSENTLSENGGIWEEPGSAVPAPLPAHPVLTGMTGIPFAFTGWGASLVLILWLVIAAGRMGRSVLNYRSARKLLYTDGIPSDSFDEALEKACKECRQRKRPRLLVSPTVATPITVGLLKPVVMIPADFTPDNAYYVFLHEITHIRRHDALYKWAVEVVVCLHWFNPAVYVLRKEISRACELSCDEAVIRYMSRQERYLYGDILLTTLGRCRTPVGAGMILPLSENAKWMKERLSSIMMFKKRSRSWSWAAFAVTAAVVSMAVLCGFTPVKGQSEAAGETGFFALGSKAGNDKAVRVNEDNESGDVKLKPGSDKMSWNEYQDVRRRSDQKSLQTKMFWSNGYMVAMAWNVDPDQYSVVRQNSGHTVCYTEKTEAYADNSAVTEAVRLSIEKQKLSKSKYGLKQDQLVLLGVDGPFESTADELALKFYEEDNISYFAAVINDVSADVCSRLMEQSYEEDRKSFFAIVSGNGDPKLQSKKTEMAKRAVNDDKSGMFAVLEENLSTEEKAQIAQEAYAADHIEIFYLTYEALNREQAWQIAEAAYNDNRIDFIYAVKELLSDSQLSSLRERARQDGKTEFIYALEW